jgi:hypothetical protein
MEGHSSMQAAQRSILTSISIVVFAAVVGLAGLPLVFGSLPDPTQAVLWLAMSVIVCVCLLIPTRVLANALAAVLAPVPEGRRLDSTGSRNTPLDLARLVTAAVYLLLLQAIVRHPVVAVFGTSAEPFVIESAIAVFAFLLLLVLLGWIYRAARPVIEGLAWSALDSLFATTRSEQAVQAADAIGPVVTSTMAAPPGSGVTVTRTPASQQAIDETIARSARVQG